MSIYETFLILGVSFGLLVKWNESLTIFGFGEYEKDFCNDCDSSNAELSVRKPLMAVKNEVVSHLKKSNKKDKENCTNAFE